MLVLIKILEMTMIDLPQELTTSEEIKQLILNYQSSLEIKEPEQKE